ncbi:D-aspartate oxidase-like [Balamuthia mandrillaris]
MKRSVTSSIGTSLHAKQQEQKILVLGAGIIGLTTATLLQRHGYDVTIWAKEIPPNTTSNVAGGLICPYISFPKDKVLRWTTETMRVFGEPQNEPFVTRQSFYEHFEAPTADPEWSVVIPVTRLVPKERAKDCIDGIRAESLVVEVDAYLQHLLDQFGESGGTLVLTTVHHIGDALQHFDIVCNCTGFGSRWLLNDDKLVPVRGQVLRVKQQGLCHTASKESPENISYFISRKNDIVLGGTAQYHNLNLSADPADTQRILKGCWELEPSLRDCSILEVRVGLRPSRSEIRLEAEEVVEDRKKEGEEKQKKRRKFVVHNYGHGGSGWTLCWGCAKEVLALVNEKVALQQDETEEGRHAKQQEARL